MEEDENEYYLCPQCAYDIYLKMFVLENATTKEVCTICEGANMCVRVDGNERLISFARFLIRYHYPEYEYNIHWGGEEVSRLFNKPNEIIRDNFKEHGLREEEVEDFIDTLFDLGSINHPVELYYGHDESGRGLFATSIKDEISKTWDKYKESLKDQNYYLLEKEALKEFTGVFEDLKYDLKSNTPFYRAAIGFDEKEEEGFLAGIPVRKKSHLIRKDFLLHPT